MSGSGTPGSAACPAEPPREQDGRDRGGRRDGDRGACSGQEDPAAREAWPAEPKRRLGRLAELTAGVVALLGILGERFGSHLVDGFGQLGPPGVKGGWWLAGVGEQGRDGPRTLERRLAGQALVEHTAQRVHVGTLVGRLGGDLLGGGVVDGAREVRAGAGACLEIGGAGQAEVGQVAVLVAALLGDEHVGGLDVAVHQPVGVGGVEGLPDLRARARLRERARAAPPDRAAS